MRIHDILNESPFDGMSDKQSQPDPEHVRDIAAARKSGTKAGMLKGLDKWAGTNAFGDNKVKSVADMDRDIDRLDIDSKKQLLAKLQRELGNLAAPANNTSPSNINPVVKT